MREFPVLDMVATGSRIHELRNQHNLTVDQVREYLGLESTQSIYKWQSGKSMPSIDNLYALSTLFETSVDDILRGSKEEDEKSSSFFANYWLYIESNFYLLYNECIFIQRRSEDVRNDWINIGFDFGCYWYVYCSYAVSQ